MAAYRLALSLHSDFVELDTHMSRDGVLVAIHDRDVKRTTGKTGRVSRLTLAQLKELDAGSWFNRAYPQKARPEYVGLTIPTVEEVLCLVKESRAGCYIEIKDPQLYPRGLESVLLSIVRSQGMGERTRIISFDADSIGRVKQLDPFMKTGLLVSRRRRDPVEMTLRAAADELAIRYDLATPEAVEKARKNRLSVSVWTVDRTVDIDRMIFLGVDRITTNYPDLVRTRISAARAPNPI